MSRLFLNKYSRLIFFLFFVSTISVTAQESNTYDELLRAPLGKDFIRMNITSEADSNVYKAQIYKDIDEKKLYKALFLPNIEFLLSKENISRFEDKKPKISPYVTMFSYKNLKNNYDTRKFNGDGTFSGEFALAGDRLISKATCGMVNIFGLASFLISQINGSTGNSNVKKESKKSKMLRTIKNDVYHVDE